MWPQDKVKIEKKLDKKKLPSPFLGLVIFFGFKYGSNVGSSMTILQGQCWLRSGVRCSLAKGRVYEKYPGSTPRSTEIFPSGSGRGLPRMQGQILKIFKNSLTLVLTVGLTHMRTWRGSGRGQKVKNHTPSWPRARPRPCLAGRHYANKRTLALKTFLWNRN